MFTYTFHWIWPFFTSGKGWTNISIKRSNPWAFSWTPPPLPRIRDCCRCNFPDFGPGVLAGTVTYTFIYGWNTVIYLRFTSSPRKMRNSSPPGWRVAFFGNSYLNLHLWRLHPGWLEDQNQVIPLFTGRFVEKSQDSCWMSLSKIEKQCK